MAAKCIYINVLRGVGPYSESGKRANYRANVKLTARRRTKDFNDKDELFGGEKFPTLFFGDRSEIGCASAAWCLRLRGKRFSAADCWLGFGLGVDAWRNCGVSRS